VPGHTLTFGSFYLLLAACCDLTTRPVNAPGPVTIPSMPVEIDIERVAHLARIALTEDEMAVYSEQLVHILEHAERIQALPTDGVEPTSHPLPMVNAFRPDEVTPSLNRDDVLAGAPDAEDGYFRVPKILDES
jgi:aspartyl-tRNA(Asn)/glutamyl-tRNA(Gln) amidotransferase subunit C